MTNRADSIDLRKDFIDQWVHAHPEASASDASLIYDLLEDEFPEVSRGGHRGMVNRQKPWEHVVHECTCCGFVAVGASEIASEFGFRNSKLADGSRKKYHQPNCPTCKNKSKEEREEIRKRSGHTKYNRVNPSSTRKFWTNGPEAGGPSTRNAVRK